LKPFARRQASSSSIGWQAAPTRDDCLLSTFIAGTQDGEDRRREWGLDGKGKSSRRAPVAGCGRPVGWRLLASLAGRYGVATFSCSSILLRLKEPGVWLGGYSFMVVRNFAASD
jgi:hypothetical protein